MMVGTAEGKKEVGKAKASQKGGKEVKKAA